VSIDGNITEALYNLMEKGHSNLGDDFQSLPVASKIRLTIPHLILFYGKSGNFTSKLFDIHGNSFVGDCQELISTLKADIETWVGTAHRDLGVDCEQDILIIYSSFLDFPVGEQRVFLDFKIDLLAGPNIHGILDLSGRKLLSAISVVINVLTTVNKLH
jgi:hypothetical protein